MLPHYRPYKIAEHFRMMAALYPNRIDLGIGNNPGYHRKASFRWNKILHMIVTMNRFRYYVITYNKG